MKGLLAGVCLLLTAGGVWAQNYDRATQQARRDSQLNDAEQQRIQREAGGGAGPPGAAAAAPAPAAPADPALQATRKNVAGLQADFAALIAASAQPAPEQKTALLNDLAQAAQGAKASSASVKRVADDLLTAVAGKHKLAVPQQQQLARKVHALFNGSHLSAAQQQSLLDDVQKLLTDGGASLDAAVNTVTDLKAVVAETK